MGLVSEILTPLYQAFEHIFRRTFTIKYPYVALKPTERTLGRHILDPSKCIGCGLCANSCPTKAIELVEWKGKKHPQIDYGRCVFCEICVSMCPKGALGITSAYELAAYDKASLVYSPEQLSVPPKPVEGRKIVSVRFYEHRGAAHAEVK